MNNVRKTKPQARHRLHATIALRTSLRRNSPVPRTLIGRLHATVNVKVFRRSVRSVRAKAHTYTSAVISALQNKRPSRGNKAATEDTVDEYPVEAVGGGRGRLVGRLYGGRVLADAAGDQESGPQVRAHRIGAPGDDQRGPFQSIYLAPGGGGPAPGRGRWRTVIRDRQARRGAALEIPGPARLELCRNPHYRTERELGDRGGRQIQSRRTAGHA